MIGLSIFSKIKNSAANSSIVLSINAAAQHKIDLFLVNSVCTATVFSRFVISGKSNNAASICNPSFLSKIEVLVLFSSVKFSHFSNFLRQFKRNIFRFHSPLPVGASHCGGRIHPCFRAKAKKILHGDDRNRGCR